MIPPVTVATADPFALKALVFGFLLGCLCGAWAEMHLMHFSVRWARTAWYEARRRKRLRRLRREPKRRDRRGVWS